MAARNTQSNGSRCASEYPGGVTLAGRAIQCDDPRGTGHDGDHGNSFAARWWTDNQGPRGWGTPDRDPIRADQERERAIAATPANPSGGPFPLRVSHRLLSCECGDGSEVACFRCGAHGEGPDALAGIACHGPSTEHPAYVLDDGTVETCAAHPYAGCAPSV